MMAHNPYVLLFKRHQAVRILSLIQLVAYMGTWFSMVAIYVLMTQLHASAILISLVAIMNFLPGVLQAPIAGAIIDTFHFKRLMLSLLLVELIATFFILFINSLDLVWLLLLLVFLRMSAASFYFTAEMSLMPQILTSAELKLTNELHSMIWALTYTAGMAIGGVVVNAYGVRTAIIIDLLFFITAIFIFLKIDVTVIIEKSTQSLLTQMREGIRYIAQNKKVLYLLLVHSSVGLTAYDALVTLLADIEYKELYSVALSIGTINAIRSLGLLLGPILVGRFINKANLDRVMLLQALSIFIWGFMQEWFYLSLIAVFFTGFLTTSIWSLSYAMIQEHTDKAYLGRVISYNEMSFMSMSVFGSFLIGYLFQSVGLPLSAVTYVLALLFLVLALFYSRIKGLYI